ncbi:MAG: glycoside hydrolase family 2 TIM barrel-domain containing protein [Armatimonadota bacterium]|nr:glycoside hydrolase family 2 TIM barrel-domain containing protein [Armatimonadota bacterium]
MKKSYDLSQLAWTLSGWTPELWRMQRTMEIGASPSAEVLGIPARVPGSVQKSLRDAGIIPDWNVGLNHRLCEWVENRHWIYETVIPSAWLEDAENIRLVCESLDYSGWIVINNETAATFVGSHVPHVFDITNRLRRKTDNVLRIVFDLPPRWLGQFGFTSRMRDWKPRFNYTWDWVPRLVQVGIAGPIHLELTDGRELNHLRICSEVRDGVGILKVTGATGNASGLSVEVRLLRGERIIAEQSVDAASFSRDGLTLPNLDVELWWPNLEGDQPLYTVECRLKDSSGVEHDFAARRVGFRTIEWRQCQGAPEGSDPWICVVNQKPVFLQGVNWTPILPNWADATESDYRQRLEPYRDLGVNCLRVWGGAFLERECFYDICDELGLMVWQEFPLSSSGIDNAPPENEKSIAEMAAIARSYVDRRAHHPSLILWSGGNELEVLGERGKPIDISHPMIKKLAEVCAQHDPSRRFVPTSPSGPSSHVDPAKVGQGQHWDVHGPWKAVGDLEREWTEYWERNDALFCSEMGHPGASSVELIQEYSGEFDPMPANYTNPLWRRTSTWWIEWDEFIREKGREPDSLKEYVEWSQARQAKALSIAVKSLKKRFPRCGGSLIWMGHDCFPCTANTSIVDFKGKPKPAALALSEIWRAGTKEETK